MDYFIPARFASKVVVVVGGNSGIGLAAAMAFACEGAQVAVAGRDEATLQNAARELGPNALACRCDVSVIDEVRKFFRQVRERFHHVDVLFVNAGVLTLQPIESVSEADWDAVHDANVKGAFFCVQAAIALMPKGSAILLTSSTAAHRGVATAASYAASKAALSGLGRALAAELVDRGIRVNVVSPGAIDTPIFDRARGLSDDDRCVIRQRQAERIPMRRLGTSQEVADAVLFLASSSAGYVNGIDFVIDGGVLGLSAG